MCGRYVISSKNKIYEIYKLKIHNNFNVVPSNYVPVLDNNLNPKIIKWNFSPIWAKNNMKLINARKESLERKPSFKNHLRCIFIANGYFEWRKYNNHKVPYYHYLPNKLIYFAGIYNKNSGCCIVTRESHARIAHIYPRQPILLKENDFDRWLSNVYDDDNSISNNLIVHRVSKIINNPLNNTYNNIKRVENE